MSPQEVQQVKARFNGCCSGSLLESSLFKGITEVLTDWKSSDKKLRKKGHILLGLVRDPHGFILRTSLFLGLYLSQLSYENGISRSESCQIKSPKVCFCQAEIKAVFFSVAKF